MFTTSQYTLTRVDPLRSSAVKATVTPAARASRRLFCFFLSFLAPFREDRDRSAPSCAQQSS